MDFLHSTQGVRHWKNMGNSTSYEHFRRREFLEVREQEEYKQKWEEYKQKWEEYKQKWEEYKQKWEEYNQKWEERRQKWEGHAQKSQKLPKPDEVSGELPEGPAPPLPSVGELLEVWEWAEHEQKWEEYKQKSLFSDEVRWTVPIALPRPRPFSFLREFLEVWEQEEREQKWEEREWKSLKLKESDEVWCLLIPSVRAVYSRRLYHPPSPQSSDCSDLSWKSAVSKDLPIDFSRKRKHELISGSSDSLHLSDDSLDEDWSSKSRSLFKEREGKQHLLDLLLSGPHDTKDGLMSSNQDQPQSEKRRSGRRRGEGCQVDPGCENAPPWSQPDGTAPPRNPNHKLF
ncbi:uncharacterized protein LOC114427113 isoform X2 [Parambassis ranga]|uniref:Uncharacterized protein LOC114427113 isoform X2 n=1 Tax=Parambassis ranga TaxID=210632 RepID=A0A6P7HQ21_9TELE|nr:uncharacterized protein LOC114427113 isoform X2 [Parambassis ranga]